MNEWIAPPPASLPSFSFCRRCLYISPINPSVRSFIHARVVLVVVCTRTHIIRKSNGTTEIEWKKQKRKKVTGILHFSVICFIQHLNPQPLMSRSPTPFHPPTNWIGWV